MPASDLMSSRRTGPRFTRGDRTRLETTELSATEYQRFETAWDSGCQPRSLRRNIDMIQTST